jgi:6-phosphogluconolactonase (cycloisomerase 2 family)
MATKVRVLFSSVVFLAMIWLVSCGGHYTCGVTFGSSSCASSGSGGPSQGGTSSGTVAAYLYVAVGGGVDGIAYNPTAKTFLEITNFVSPKTANVPPQGMVIAQKKFLYTSAPLAGQIFGFSIAANGSLTAISGSPFTAPYMTGSAPIGTQTMVANPAGTLLFVSNTNGNTVYVYQIGSAGGLTPVNTTGFSVPFAPADLAVDGLGKYLYVSTDTTGSEIAAFTIGSDDSLTTVPGSPFSYPMLQLQGEPSGKYLIGTTGSSTDNHLYVFGIAQSGTSAGAISPVSGSPFATVYPPSHVAVQPNSGGNLVYSFSINESNPAAIVSNPTEGYQLDLSTGQLKLVAGSPFTGATGNWGQFDQSGTLLFVFDTYKTVMYGENVGSGGTLTQTLSVGFFDDPWAVTDPQ